MNIVNNAAKSTHCISVAFLFTAMLHRAKKAMQKSVLF